MTDEATQQVPLLEVRHISKYFGSVNALQDISLAVHAGEVTCVLGDNGAGESTLIKILSGVFPPDDGVLLVDGQPLPLASPRAARTHGIATVYQDLAMIPLMPIWRTSSSARSRKNGALFAGSMLRRPNALRGSSSAGWVSTFATPTRRRHFVRRGTSVGRHRQGGPFWRGAHPRRAHLGGWR
jgi:ABC-type branched-subunit amino acid transport system ATPase component